MTTTEDGWTSVLECNRVVWSRLLAWKLLLFQLADEKYRSDKKFIGIVQFTCQLFERDLHTSLTIEESGLYAHVEAEVPRLRGLVKQLRLEHAALRKHLEIIHWEFSDDASFDRPELLRASVAELAHTLRAHMRRDEDELVPVLLKSQQPASEAGPGRIGPYASTSEDGRVRRSEDVA
jgi:hypothetical protein